MIKTQIKAEIRGIARVFAKLDEAQRAKAVPALERAIHKSGYMVERTAKQLCPVDTGRLRKSIHNVPGKMRSVVRTNVSYAPYQEFGTSKMGAQPYMRPALKRNVPKILRLAEAEVRRSLNK